MKEKFIRAYEGDLMDPGDFAMMPKPVQEALMDLSRSENRTGDLKRAADSLSTFLAEYDSYSEGVVGKVEVLKNKILDRLAINDSKVEIDEDSIRIMEKDLELGSQIDKLKNGEEFDPRIIIPVLERRKWGKVFNKLEKGDRVVTFLVPGAEFLSIKYLNDEIFGMQGTDKIIEQKRKVIAEELIFSLKELNENIVAGDLVLDQYYKADVFRIPKGMDLDLSHVAFNVDKRMTDFIKNQAEELLKDENTDKKKIQAFIQKLSGSDGAAGYRVNYGVSDTEGDNMKDKILALNRSMQAARMSRENKYEYGENYNEEEILSELDEIASLKNSLRNANIVDENGNDFPIFDEDGFLNRDLLRVFRKGKFKKNTDLSNDFALFIKKLNIIDHVKPFLFEEVSDTAEEIEENHVYVQKIKSGLLLKEEREVVADILSTSEKQTEYTSRSEFNKRAKDIRNCAYVSIDMVDLGLDVAREYEERIAKVLSKHKKERLKEFNEQSLAAGDLVTKALREFRSEVSSLCRKYGVEDEDGKTLGHIGGDELTLAIDLDKVSEGKIEELIFEIKKVKNTRIVKTLVASSEKKLGENVSERDKVTSHLEALKRAERGVQILKQVEEIVRKVNKHKLQISKLEPQLGGIFSTVEGEIKSDFVVVERDNEFHLISKDGHGAPRSYKYKEISPVIDDVHEQLVIYE